MPHDNQSATYFDWCVECRTKKWLNKILQTLYAHDTKQTKANYARLSKNTRIGLNGWLLLWMQRSFILRLTPIPNWRSECEIINKTLILPVLVEWMNLNRIQNYITYSDRTFNSTDFVYNFSTVALGRVVCHLCMCMYRSVVLISHSIAAKSRSSMAS